MPLISYLLVHSLRLVRSDQRVMNRLSVIWMTDLRSWIITVWVCVVSLCYFTVIFGSHIAPVHYLSLFLSFLYVLLSLCPVMSSFHSIFLSLFIYYISYTPTRDSFPVVDIVQNGEIVVITPLLGTKQGSYSENCSVTQTPMEPTFLQGTSGWSIHHSNLLYM